MIKVTLFTKPDCHLCEQTKADLQSLQTIFPHELVEVNIDGNRDLQLAYGLEIPVVEIGPYRLKAPITLQELQMTLGAAMDRKRHLESLDEPGYRERLQHGWTVTSADRISYWLSNHYMALFNLFVFAYLGLPFLAPVLMTTGVTAPARLIYRAYGAVCHQFAFRSWFLFGEQAAYPRAAAGVAGLIPFGQATGLNEADLWGARNFIGNPALGYKIALCERDVAIYGGILLFGLIFVLTARRLKSFPWYLWILIGILPIGLDGFSQILSQPPLNTIPLMNLLPYRESTPILRTLTGALFGLTTAWFGYPMVEESMADTRQYMASKFARVKEKLPVES
jgi:uncharacterized membrane protein